ncbi:MAG TPA: hypothetical protein ENH23_00865 [candidate division Zixibacteria bacterium]|nr:hypothetical protein [candidate division Zixibacteria bacterium]
MISLNQYNKNEKAYYFASQATASLVYLEGGFILRIGLNSKTVDKPHNHDFCECGGVPGELSEIAVKLIGALAVSKIEKKGFSLSKHEDFLIAQQIAKNLDKEMRILSPGVEKIMQSAEERAKQMLEEIWIAIEKLAQAILQFDKIDQEETTNIVKNALKGKTIEKSALSWNTD